MKQSAYFIFVALLIGIFLHTSAHGAICGPSYPPQFSLIPYSSIRVPLSIIDDVSQIAPTSLGPWSIQTLPTMDSENSNSVYMLGVLIPLPDGLPIPTIPYGLYIYHADNGAALFSATEIKKIQINLKESSSQFWHQPCSDQTSLPLSLPIDFSGRIQIAIIPNCSMSIPCSKTSFPLSRQIYPYVFASIEIDKIYTSPPLATPLVFTSQASDLPSQEGGGPGGPNLPRPNLSQLCPFVKLATGVVVPTASASNTSASIPLDTMCSARTAGGWIKYPRDGNDTTVSICDCPCIGYWIDNPATVDNFKCTKCGLQCPDLMSPNADCTGCECSNNVCKRYNRYVHTLLYLDLQHLELFHQLLHPPTPPNSPNSVEFPFKNVSELFLSNATKYQSTVFLFNDLLAGYLLKEMQSTSDPSPTFVNSVSIRPLVYGSFRVWKVTLDIDCNVDDFSPQKNFGMPPSFSDPATIRHVFLQAIQSRSQFATFKFKTPLTDSITFASPSYTSILPDSSDIPSIYYVDDHLETFCALNSQNPSQLEYNIAKTQKCPSPQDYALSNSLDANIPPNQQYWSPCQDSTMQSIQSLVQTSKAIDNGDFVVFDVVEDILPTSGIADRNFQETQVAKTYCRNLLPNYTLSVSSLKPVCFDFTGVNLALYGVSCGWNGPLVYNSNSSTLLLPYDIIFSFEDYLLQNPIYNTAAYTIISQALQHPPLSFPGLPQVFTLICPGSKIFQDSSPPLEFTCSTSFVSTTAINIKSDPNTNISSHLETLLESFLVASDDVVSQLSDLRTTPTTFSPLDVLHISWTVPVSRDTQFIPLEISMTTTQSNTGSGTFLWSQSLTSSVASTQYVHAQVPSTDSSLLFQRISLDSDLKNKYGTMMLVRAKIPNSRLASLSIENELEFNFPALCTTKSISCHDPTSQYCNQATARCLCRPGFVDQSQVSLQALEYTYNPENQGFVDGTALNCVPICQNAGQYEEASGKCSCASGFFGPTCQIVAQCNPASIYTAITATVDTTADTIDTTTFIHKICNNGYLTVQATSPACGTDTSNCNCLPNWDNTVLNDQINSRCDICQLNPLTPTTTSNDLLYTQAYTPSQFQQCYAAGTDEKSYTPGNCQRCQCKRGFTGAFCQLHEFYIAVNFTSRNTYDYDPATQFLFEDKLRHELSNSFQRSVGSKEITKDMIRLVELSFTNRYWIAGIRSGVDFFLKNAKRNSQFILLKEQRDGLLMQHTSTRSQEQNGSNAISIQSTLSLEIESLEHTMNLLQVGSETAPGGFSDLFDQWDKLQSQYNNSNIGSQDVNDYLNDGSSSNQNTPISNPYDPSCAVYYSDCSASTQDSFDVWKTAPVDPEIPEETNTTPSSGKTSSTTLIIAVVVSISVVIIFFIIFTAVMLWAKKNQKLFWKPKTNQSKVHGVELSVASSTSVTKTGSIAASSSSPTSISTTDPMLSQTRIPVEDSSLSSDWEAFQGAGQGEIFYVNKITLQSQWIHPVSGASTKSASGW